MKIQLSKIFIIGMVIASVPPSPTVTALTTTEILASGRKPGASIVSWYSTETCKHNPHPKCLTADGSSLYELEKKNEFFGASYRYPLGSRIRITYEGRSVDITIRDRGPNRRLKRELDLSRNAFQLLAPLRKGLIKAHITRIK